MRNENFEEDLFKTELELASFFEGIVKINFTLNASTDTIVLHADNSLKIKSTVQIFDSSSNLVASVSNFTYGENQLFLLNLNQTINPGDYILNIDYSAVFGSLSNLYGFYRTQYTEENVIKY
jgi:hypothetical protein